MPGIPVAGLMDDARLRRLQASQSLAVPLHATKVTTTQRKRIEARVIYRASPPATVETVASQQTAATQGRLETLAIIEETSRPPMVREELVEEETAYDEEEADDDAPLVPLMKPVFVKKTSRKDLEQMEQHQELAKKAKEREAHELLLQYVRREYEASGASKDDSDVVASLGDPLVVDDVDDDSDVAELEAWRLRELLRIKRDREEREHWEREKMELERVRNMTEEERRRLDEEKMKEWMAQPKSQMRFMQKYYHKGAFFQDPAESLLQRDYAQPTGEDARANREMLPEVKQVRDFGKKGRTKWTHLVAEDTTEFSYGWGQRKNEMNYKLISKMGGMKGHLDNPSKRPKT